MAPLTLLGLLAVTAMVVFYALEHRSAVKAAANIPFPSLLPSPPVGEGKSEKTAQEIILNAIRTKGKAQRHDLLPLVTVSKSTLVRLLDKMEAEGLVVQVGERKASYYALAKPETGAR